MSLGNASNTTAPIVPNLVSPSGLAATTSTTPTTGAGSFASALSDASEKLKTPAKDLSLAKTINSLETTQIITKAESIKLTAIFTKLGGSNSLEISPAQLHALVKDMGVKVQGDHKAHKGHCSHLKKILDAMKPDKEVSQDDLDELKAILAQLEAVGSNGAESTEVHFLLQRLSFVLEVHTTATQAKGTSATATVAGATGTTSASTDAGVSAAVSELQSVQSSMVQTALGVNSSEEAPEENFSNTNDTQASDDAPAPNFQLNTASPETTENTDEFSVG